MQRLHMYRYSGNKEGQEGVAGAKRMDVEAADVQTRMGAETTKRMEETGFERAKRLGVEAADVRTLMGAETTKRMEETGIEKAK